MPPAPTPPTASRVDVRTLSLAQLQLLADRGSRRARAELEGRMRAAEAQPVTSRAAVNDGFAAPMRPPGSPAVAPTTPRRAPVQPPAELPTLTERADASGPAPLGVVRAGQATPANANAAAQPLPEALQKRLELIAQQEDSASRASGPPRLLGMVMIAWGALLVLGGLVTLAHGGGFYYLFCGAGSAAVGWLLMRCSRWAMVLHGVLLLVALGWAWRSENVPNIGLMLVQAAPIWVAALWMTIRQVREGLE